MGEYHFHIGDIHWKAVESLISFVNQISDSQSNIIVHLKSRGGEIGAKVAMVNIINRFNHEIHVYCAESCAFEIINETTGRVVIHNTSHAMYHLGEIQVDIKDGRTYDNLAKAKMNESDLEYERSMDTANKLNFKEKEIESLKEGLDVYFDQNRLKKMFKHRL